MNKYSILKFSNDSDRSSDEFFNTCRIIRSNVSTRGISSFASNENLHKSKSSILTPVMSTTYKFPELSKIARPSYQDFSKLLSKLEIVTSTKNHSNNDCILAENEQIECIVEEGMYNYIKTPVKGKKSPLRIFIKKIQGKIIVYSSFANPKPGISNFDQVFHQDNFEIRSPEPNFKNDYLYIGIRGIAFSKILVSARFGKNKIHLFDDKKMKKTGNEVVEKSEKNVKKKKKLFLNKFLETEYKQIRLLSPDEILKRHKEWITKRELILKKRKKALEEKKIKALKYANRQEIRHQELQAEKKIIESKILQENKAKEWLTLLYFLKSFNFFNQAKIVKRQKITRKLTKITKVRQIQKLFRQSTKGLKITDLSILRSQKLLTLYYNSLFNPISIRNKTVLVKIIQLSGIFKKPILKFEKFFNEIVSIQKYFRKYLSVKYERMKKLIKFWDQSKSFQIRRSLKKKNQIYQISVSIGQRATVLQNYYLKCIENFYNSYRFYKREKIFISELPEKEIKKRMPKVNFEYMPTILVMKEMIESASSISENDTIQVQ